MHQVEYSSVVIWQKENTLILEYSTRSFDYWPLVVMYLGWSVSVGSVILSMLFMTLCIMVASASVFFVSTFCSSSLTTRANALVDGLTE